MQSDIEDDDILLNDKTNDKISSGDQCVAEKSTQQKNDHDITPKKST